MAQLFNCARRQKANSVVRCKQPATNSRSKYRWRSIEISQRNQRLWCTNNLTQKTFSFLFRFIFFLQLCGNSAGFLTAAVNGKKNQSPRFANYKMRACKDLLRFQLDWLLDVMKFGKSIFAVDFESIYEKIERFNQFSFSVKQLSQKLKFSSKKLLELLRTI